MALEDVYSENAVNIYKKLYLARNNDNEVIETIEECHERVANFLADSEEEYQNFKRLLDKQRFRPNTPCMANAGVKKDPMMLACFPKGTLIRTKNSLTPIEDIQKNDKVLTHKGRFKKVKTPMKRNYKGFIYNIKPTTIDGFETTNEHPVYVLSKENFDCHRARDGGSCNPMNNGKLSRCFPKERNYKTNCEKLNKNFRNELIWKNAEEVEEGDHLIVTFDNGIDDNILYQKIDISKYLDYTWKKDETHVWFREKYKTKRFIKIDEDFLLLLGYFAAEGTNTYTSRTGFSFNAINEDHYIDEVSKIFESVTGVLPKTSYNEKGGCVAVNICSKPFHLFIANEFGTSTCHDFSLPDWIMKLSPKYQEAFLIGFLRGDSHITKNGSLSIALANQILAHQIWELFLRQGIITNLHKTPVIVKNKEYITYRLGTQLDYSHKNLIKKIWPSKCVSLKKKNYSYRRGYFIDDNKIAIRIKEISVYEADLPVYNLEVETDHTYTVRNIIVHNCFVLDLQDTMDSIINMWGTCAKIYEGGGGAGIPITNLRRKGAGLSKGGYASGPLSYLNVIEVISEEIKSGGKQRRAANLIAAKYNHPDIKDIINCKRDKKSYKSMNLSIVLDDEFMEQVKNAMEKKISLENVELLDPNEGPTGETISVIDLWKHICQAAWETGDPGLLFIDRVNIDNPLDVLIESTNPCIVGETKVAVADGRGSVPIKKLAKQGKDVDVFCIENDELTIKRMRNPRKTGNNVDIIRVHLDSGDYLDVTKNHKFVLLNNEIREAQDLKPDDKLKVASRTKTQNSTKQYWHWNYITKSYCEHRMIAKTPDDMICHHKDGNGLNNRPKNLKNINRETHNVTHSESFSGEKNGRFLGVTNEDMLQFGVNLALKLKRQFSRNEWISYGEELGITLPTKFTKYRNRSFASFRHFSITCAKEAGVIDFGTDPRLLKTLSKAIEQGYNAIITKNRVHVEKTCEGCGQAFMIPYHKREISYCGFSCYAKHRDYPYPHQLVNSQKERNTKTLKSQITVFKDLQKKLNRDPMKKEWTCACAEKEIPHRIGKGSPFQHWNDFKEAAQDGNHRVVKIENIGKADVYNGTVDDVHNMLIGGFKGVTNKGNEKYSYINTLQCGESPLIPDSCCDLGHLNMTCYEDSEDPAFEHDIYWSTLFLNRIIDKSSYPNKKFEENMKKYRPIGLGLMGFADYLYREKIRYGSQKSCEVLHNFTKKLTKHAFTASSKLVKKGSIPNIMPNLKTHEIKRFADILERYGLSFGWEPYGWDSSNAKYIDNIDPLPGNITVTTIAPTGSTALSADCSYSTEPQFGLIWTKVLDTGETMEFLNPYFLDALYAINGEHKNKYSQPELIELIKRNKGAIQNIPYIPQEIKDVFVTAHDIPNEQRLEVQAAAQRNITMAVSSTVNLPKSASTADVAKIYLMAWEKDLKGITVYRDGSLDAQPIDFGTEAETQQAHTEAEMPISEESEPTTASSMPLFGKSYERPMERNGKVVEVNTPAGKLYVRGSFDNGKLMEVFLDVGQQGSRENVLFNGLGRVISRSLQRGVDLSDITDTLRGSGGDHFWIKLNSNEERSYPVEGILDAVATILDEKFSGEHVEGHVSTITIDSDIIDLQEYSLEDSNAKVVAGYSRCPECQRYTLRMDAGCRGGICTVCGFSNCQ